MPDSNEKTCDLSVIKCDDIRSLVVDLERLRLDDRYRTSTRQAAAKLIVYLGKFHSRLYADDCIISSSEKF